MSWWSDRWEAACLDHLGSSNPQVDAGISLASKGRASIVHVEPGQIRAEVRDRRDLHVDIGVQQLDPLALETLAVALAKQPLLGAAVLTGELPFDVDGLLLDAGMNLLPGKKASFWLIVSATNITGLSPWRCCPLGVRQSRRRRSFCAVVGPWHRPRDQLVAKLREIRGLNQAGPQSDEHARRDPGTAASAAFRRPPSPVAPSASPAPAVYPATLLPSPPLDGELSAIELQALIFGASERAVQLLRGEGDGSEGAG
ncbi:MAG: hypothetical protein R2706_02215 [Acidimicrobiales bacterium]